MLEAGRVVFASSGRDKGSFYLVTGSEEGRILIADGDRRKLEHPKKKNPAHLVPTPDVIPLIEVTGNRKLKTLLSGYRDTANRIVNS